MTNAITPNFERVRNLDRLGLIVGDPSTYYAEQQDALLIMDLRDGEIWAETACQCETAVSSLRWHGVHVAFQLPRDTDAEALTAFCDEHTADFQAILDGAEVDYDRGGNLCGTLDEDAQEAVDRLRPLLEGEAIQLNCYPDPGGYIGAELFLRDDPYWGKTREQFASLTPAELTDFIAEVSADVALQCPLVVCPDLDEHFRDLWTELQD